uniref:Uncharacterized protein n=1 Tax=Oryza brachyantha TaxID=4533 RepID=J3N0G6_ORYBR
MSIDIEGMFNQLSLSCGHTALNRRPDAKIKNFFEVILAKGYGSLKSYDHNNRDYCISRDVCQAPKPERPFGAFRVAMCACRRLEMKMIFRKFVFDFIDFVFVSVFKYRSRKRLRCFPTVFIPTGGTTLAEDVSEEPGKVVQVGLVTTPPGSPEAKRCASVDADCSPAHLPGEDDRYVGTELVGFSEPGTTSPVASSSTSNSVDCTVPAPALHWPLPCHFLPKNNIVTYSDLPVTRIKQPMSLASLFHTKASNGVRSPIAFAGTRLSKYTVWRTASPENLPSTDIPFRACLDAREKKPRK